MDDFVVGREFQSLVTRIEKLEEQYSSCRMPCSEAVPDGNVPDREYKGGVEEGTDPILWKPEKPVSLKDLPPFLLGLLDIPFPVRGDKKLFDIKPEQKTWQCTPEPLIITVNWDNGRSDEFYRLEKQVFSVLKFADPNTGIFECRVLYSATLKASGRGKSRFTPGYYQNGLSSPAFTDTTSFDLRVLGAGGAFLGYANTKYSIGCSDNMLFTVYNKLNPGLYDLVTGAEWNIGGTGVHYC